tara:strand:- start:284 stop:460 length:177 start_codon:yes stop_codon:yes gene_type:complete
MQNSPAIREGLIEAHRGLARPAIIIKGLIDARKTLSALIQPLSSSSLYTASSNLPNTV